MAQDNATVIHYRHLEKKLDDHSEEHDKLWNAISELQNRLPLWATMLISVLCSLLGGSMAVLGDLIIRGIL